MLTILRALSGQGGESLAGGKMSSGELSNSLTQASAFSCTHEPGPLLSRALKDGAGI